MTESEKKRKVQAALEARKNRNAASAAPVVSSSSASKSKVQQALEVREQRIRSSMPKLLTDIGTRYKSAADAYNRTQAKYNAYDEVYKGQQEQRKELAELRAKVGAYSRYMDQKTAQELMAGLDQMGQGYDTYLTMSRYATENAWNKALEEAQAKAKRKEEILSAPDFEELSQYASTVGDRKFVGYFTNNHMDETYEYINDKDGARKKITRNTVGTGSMGALNNREFFDRQNLSEMTQEEVSIYNYLYAKEGKESAEEYLNSIREELNMRRGGEIAQEVRARPGIVRVPAMAAVGLGAGGDQFFTGAQQFFTSEKLPTTAVAQANSDIYNSLSGFGQQLYSATNVIGNMAPSVLVSSLTTALGGPGQLAGGIAVGISAAGNAYGDAISKGYDKGRARVYSTLVGAAEGGLEALLGGIGKLGGSLTGKLMSKVNLIDNTLLRLSAKVGVDFLGEVTEEEIQNFLEPALRAIIFSEAYDPPKWEELLETAVITAITTPIMGSGDIFTQAKDSAEYRSKYGAKQAEIVNKALEVNPESKYAQQMKGKVDNGQNLSGHTLNQLITESDTTVIQKATEQRLREVGATENVEAIAAALTKKATGEGLTLRERSLIKDYDFVAEEMNPENIRQGKFNADWVKNIGTQKINRAEYNIQEAKNESVKAEAPKNVTAPKAETKAAMESPAVAEDNVTRQVSTGKVVTPKKIVQLENGKAVIETDAGQISSDDISFKDKDTDLLWRSTMSLNNMDASSANGIILAYDGSTDVATYVQGAAQEFQNGFKSKPSGGEYADSLSQKQQDIIYALGNMAAKRQEAAKKAESIKKMREAVGEKKSDKKMTITYNAGNGKVVDFKDSGIKDRKAKLGTGMAQILHDMGLGTDFEFYSSYLSKTLKDKDGNRLRVMLDENGNEVAAPSGMFRNADNKILIDLNAYNGRKLTLVAMSHEITHMIQMWSDVKYRELADFLVETYEKTGMTMHQRVLREQSRLEEIRGEEVSYSESFDEVVANAMGKMLSDEQVMGKLAELRAVDANLADKLVAAIKEILDKFANIFKKNEALYWDNADLLDMKEEYDRLKQLWAEAFVEASENFRAAQSIGFELDIDTESVSPAVMRSEQSWQESDYVKERDKAAEDISKAIGVTVKKAKDYIDSINSVAKMIAEDRTRLDYFSSPYRSSFVDNAEYGGSFDFSTLCKKRRLLTGTFTAIQKALPNTALTADEILDIRNRMKKAGLEVSCGLCYVEGSRANMGQFAKEFLRLYKQYYPDSWQPNMADVNTPEGIEWVRINHPECYEQYEYFWNHYGTLKEGDKNLFASQQKPKLYQLHTEYKSEILTKFRNDDKVEEKNRNGGIRLQSFSDFEIVHLIDTMQIIMDMSRVGLAGQAYTKVPDFAWALGDTGLKINLSLIAKGVDENGKLIFDDVEGMPIAEAMKLRKRYSDNVGTILVAFNDEQLKAAMADERVDFIIPFHRSQWKKSQYEAMGLPAKTKDYTYMQNEKFIKPQYHEYRGRMVKDKATNYMPNEYWDFSKSGKENAVAYLEMCARNNKRPKFYKLLTDNGDGSYSMKADGSTDGYWKLLIDFKMYDNDGNGSPQMSVKPDFNMEEATRMLESYKGGHSSFPVAQGIVDEFVNDYKKSHKGVQYSSQQTDVDRQQYNSFREKFAKERLDDLSDKLGKLFPLSAGFEQAIQNDKTKVSNMTIVANSQKKASGESYYTAAKNAFKKIYGAKTTFSIKQLGTTAEADESFTRESISKVSHAKERQTILDLTPEFKQLIEESRLLAVERTIHNDNKKTSLLCYRLYNAYIRKEAYIDQSGNTQTSEVPHIVVFNVVQNLNDAKAHMVTDINDVAIRNGHNSSKLKYATHANGNINIDNIADVYAVVKGVDRKNGGLRYSAEDNLKYKFDYTQKNTGERYSTQETDNITNRDLLANAFEGVAQDSEEYKLIQQYKGRIKLISGYEEQLDEVNAQIREMTYGRAARDEEKLQQLRKRAKDLAGNISRNDKTLLKLEASEPLRRVLQQEKAVARDIARAEIRGLKKDASVYEKEFVRIAKAYEKLETKSAAKSKSIDDLKAALRNETKSHKADQKIWEAEFNRLLREYESVERSVDKLEQRLERQNELSKERVESRKRTEVRHKIQKVVKELNDMLLREDKKKHVPDNLKKAVAHALDLVNMDTSAAEERAAKYAALIEKETDPDKIDAYTATMERLLTQGKKTGERLKELKDAYAEIANSTDPDIQDAYVPEIEDNLEELAKTIGDTSLRDMTIEQLSDVYDMFKAVLTRVRDANKLFAQEKSENAQMVAEEVAADFASRKIPEKERKTFVQKLFNKIGWDYEKLYYALDRINSPAFTRLIQAVADSENITMQDVMEAKAFRNQMAEKYGYNNWSMNRKTDREFLDSTGKKFKLTLGEMMSLYAYSRRDKAWNHIEYGGFVFGKTALTDPRPADSYKLDKEGVKAITDLLTPEQRAYAEEMQQYLSETMGAKGNEVTMKLYGIKIFKEKNYFPVHVSGVFSKNAQETQAKQAEGFGRMADAGFTKTQNPDATAPFVLEGFTEIWADHVNEMSRYHGAVPALEDLRRVMNRATYSDNTTDSTSVKQVMENHFGIEAVKYFDNLYREANSGATRDKLESGFKKMVSLFRKNSVAYSLSVLVQQPMSIYRAYGMIDGRYFGKNGFGSIASGLARTAGNRWTGQQTKLYEEMLKYAPGVTMAKEIGGFDTAKGGSIRRYLMEDEKTIKQAWQTGTGKEKYSAAMGIVDDNFVANIPNAADKLAWIEIWNACKRETVHNNHSLSTGSEEFMEKVGQRFTEVIRATQVYDSIFAKSPMLKSQSGMVQMIVSFMNEPNTVANMAESAVRDFQRGNKRSGFRKACALVQSIIMTGVAKSIIYAMRDDDEDETFAEKYTESFVESLLSDFNPFSYIPIGRDAWSITKGYKVERADMEIIADVLDAIGGLTINLYKAKDKPEMTDAEILELDKKITKSSWKLAETLMALVGIPLKNMKREVDAILNLAKTKWKEIGKTTKMSAWDKIYDAVIDSIPFAKNRSKVDKLYDAMLRNDTEYIERLKSGYKTDSAYRSAISSGLRANDSRIREAAKARISGDFDKYKELFYEIKNEGVFAFDDIMRAVNSYISSITEETQGYKAPDRENTSASVYTADDYYISVITGNIEDSKAIWKDLVAEKRGEGYLTHEAESAVESGFASNVKAAYMNNEISEAKAADLLVSHGGKESKSEAKSEIEKWNFELEHGYSWGARARGYRLGDISASDLKSAVMSVEGSTAKEAAEYIRFLNLEMQHEEINLTASEAASYYKYAEPAGINVTVYLKYRDQVSSINGDGKKERRMAVIDSLPITKKQKDALYRAEGWAESKLDEAPWN